METMFNFAGYDWKYVTLTDGHKTIKLTYKELDEKIKQGLIRVNTRKVVAVCPQYEDFGTIDGRREIEGYHIRMIVETEDDATSLDKEVGERMDLYLKKQELINMIHRHMMDCLNLRVKPNNSLVRVKPKLARQDKCDENKQLKEKLHSILSRARLLGVNGSKALMNYLELNDPGAVFILQYSNNNKDIQFQDSKYALKYPEYAYCVTDMSTLFKGTRYDWDDEKKIDISGWDTSRVNCMAEMFKLSENLEYVDMHGLDLREVRSMNKMFCMCRNLREVNMDNVKVNGSVCTDNMFVHCWNIENVSLNNVDETFKRNVEEQLRTWKQSIEIDE